MKNSAYLIILLALVLVPLAYKSVSSKPAEAPAEASTEQTVYDAIMTRTSVRAYTDRPVSDSMVDTLLRAAMAAPTAGNKQPWRFVVIRDRETLRFIAENFRTMTMAADAGVGIVVCGDPNATFPGDGQGYWVQDASAATENLLLAAHASGLGAVWCGVYPMPDRVKQFSELLQLPDSILPLNFIAIGYPSGDPTPKDKWHPEYVHYEKWSDAK